MSSLTWCLPQQTFDRAHGSVFSPTWDDPPPRIEGPKKQRFDSLRSYLRRPSIPKSAERPPPEDNVSEGDATLINIEPSTDLSGLARAAEEGGSSSRGTVGAGFAPSSAYIYRPRPHLIIDIADPPAESSTASQEGSLGPSKTKKQIVSFKRSMGERASKNTTLKVESEPPVATSSKASTIDGTMSSSRRRTSKLRRPPPSSYLNSQGKICPTCGNCQGHPANAENSSGDQNDSFAQPIPRRVVFPPAVRMSRRLTRYSGFDPRSSTYRFIHSTIDFADPTLPDLNFLDGLAVPSSENDSNEKRKSSHKRSSSVPIFKRAFSSSSKSTFLIFGSRESELSLPQKSRRRLIGRRGSGAKKAGNAIAEVHETVEEDSGAHEDPSTRQSLDERHRAASPTLPADEVEAALMFMASSEATPSRSRSSLIVPTASSPDNLLASEQTEASVSSSSPPPPLPATGSPMYQAMLQGKRKPLVSRKLSHDNPSSRTAVFPVGSSSDLIGSKDVLQKHYAIPNSRKDQLQQLVAELVQKFKARGLAREDSTESQLSRDEEQKSSDTTPHANRAGSPTGGFDKLSEPHDGLFDFRQHLVPSPAMDPIESENADSSQEYFGHSSKRRVDADQTSTNSRRRFEGSPMSNFRFPAPVSSCTPPKPLVTTSLSSRLPRTPADEEDDWSDEDEDDDDAEPMPIRAILAQRLSPPTPKTSPTPSNDPRSQLPSKSSLRPHRPAPPPPRPSVRRGSSTQSASQNPASILKAPLGNGGLAHQVTEDIYANTSKTSSPNQADNHHDRSRSQSRASRRQYRSRSRAPTPPIVRSPSQVPSDLEFDTQALPPRAMRSATYPPVGQSSSLSSLGQHPRRRDMGTPGPFPESDGALQVSEESDGPMEKPVTYVTRVSRLQTQALSDALIKTPPPLSSSFPHSATRLSRESSGSMDESTISTRQIAVASTPRFITVALASPTSPSPQAGSFLTSALTPSVRPSPTTPQHRTEEAEDTSSSSQLEDLDPKSLEIPASPPPRYTPRDQSLGNLSNAILAATRPDVIRGRSPLSTRKFDLRGTRGAGHPTFGSADESALSIPQLLNRSRSASRASSFSR